MERAANGRRRLRIDRAGYKCEEEAGNRWSRLPREGRLRNEIHRGLPGRRRGK